MRSLPLIIVAGVNDLALRVCEELCSTAGHEVVLVGELTPLIGERAAAYGARTLVGAPEQDATLEAAGVREADCIIPVGDDDRINLRVALKARDANPSIRIVLRQFNRALGRKIEQNLSQCSAISPATHAAATFAAASVDASTIQALQFPSADGVLVSFAERQASEFGLGGTTVADAEERVCGRVLSVDGEINPPPDRAVDPAARIVVCAAVDELQGERRGDRRSTRRSRRRRRTRLRDAIRPAVRFEPLLLYTVGVALLVFVAAALYFELSLHLTPLESMYFVAATMFTVGYGDITPYVRHGPWASYVVAIVVMGMGVSLGGVFIASISAVLSRAQETALRGLRQIRAEHHVVVCGAGNVGTRVIEFLLELGQAVVVIEPQPNARVLELARSRRIDLLASDAADDDTLAFCNLSRAKGLVAATNSDTANLEAALGGLAHNAQLPVVLRIGDIEFANSVARNFSLAKSYATSDLTAPVIAGLSRFPASRGRVSFAGEVFAVGERTPDMYVPRREGGIPLFVFRAGELRAIRNFDQAQPGDRLLDLVPLSQFRAAHG